MPEETVEIGLDYHYNRDNNQLYITSRGFTTRSNFTDLYNKVEMYFHTDKLIDTEFAQLTQMLDLVRENIELFEEGVVFDAFYGKYYRFPEWVRNNARSVGCSPSHYPRRLEFAEPAPLPEATSLSHGDVTLGDDTISLLGLWFEEEQSGWDPEVFIDNIDGVLCVDPEFFDLLE